MCAERRAGGARASEELLHPSVDGLLRPRPPLQLLNVINKGEHGLPLIQLETGTPGHHGGEKNEVFQTPRAKAGLDPDWSVLRGAPASLGDAPWSLPPSTLALADPGPAA